MYEFEIPKSIFVVEINAHDDMHQAVLYAPGRKISTEMLRWKFVSSISSKGPSDMNDKFI